MHSLYDTDTVYGWNQSVFLGNTVQGCGCHSPYCSALGVQRVLHPAALATLSLRFNEKPLQRITSI
jgi:hypothetical protein